MGQIALAPREAAAPQKADPGTRIDRALAAARTAAEKHKPAVEETALEKIYRQVLPKYADMPENTNLKLDVDDLTGRVIGRIVKRETGELVVQIPTEEMLTLIARTKELSGLLVNEKV